MRYFNGEPESFSDIPLSPKGTAFQQAIWTALRQIPYGKTASYGGLAESINNPKAVRAVGGAVGSNPISIIIPCHRVLGKKCEITGFGGGLPAKRFLLKLENIPYIDKGVEYVKTEIIEEIPRMIPQTEQALLEKAQSIAGLTFGELADELNIPVPPDLKRDKGWVGMLLETALGATAGSKAEQDFPI